MEICMLRGGTYAIFRHRGLASTSAKTMPYIMGSWLPNSTYELDNREHFEVLPESPRTTTHKTSRPKNEVWVLVRPKKA